MEKIISSQELNELLQTKGETRGLGFKTEAQFVSAKEGGEDKKKLEETMAKLGFPYKEIKNMDFYPIGWLGVALVVMHKLFGFGEKEFQEMGKFEAKSSLVIRLFMKYFVSLERVKKEAGRMWREYYTVGKLEVTELNKKERYILVRIENFKLHPFLCEVLKGYLMSIVKMIVNLDTTCKEEKCVFKGDDYHQFRVSW